MPAGDGDDHVVQRSDLYTKQAVELATARRQVNELQASLSRVKAEWSQALGNAEFVQKTMEELKQKHAKKWAELTNNAEADTAAEHNNKAASSQEANDESTTIETITTASQTEQIVVLEHKLTQALENVRQAESTRQALNEAIAMNESLQAKLEEIKAKYAILQQGRSSTNNNSSSSNAVSSSTASTSTGTLGVSTPKQKPTTLPSASTSQSAEKIRGEMSREDKLYRDNRKMRKELDTLRASKEAAKAKLERAEKERDAVLQINSRLLKQTAEKDDMNAKSLSTILHLKQVTEQIAKEKQSLEQQTKTANQLALAARLATNARERVAEEFDKAHESLEKRADDWEGKCSDLAKEKEVLDGKLSQQIAKMSALLKDATKAKVRCEELATESTKLHDEKRRVMESLAVAQREASEAKNLSESLAKSSGGGGGGGGMKSEFSADQLATQVSVLKGRLICPVCNSRDKKCILLRCRHMFCKSCVDESIKNRSRKCPACGQRFDTKDVADVWL
jgi:E3 ubiquitin-protein ligase BRE1